MAYPGALDSFTTKTDGVTEVLAAHVNDLQSAIVAIETELGTDPAGTLTDLKTRLVKSLSTAGNLQFAAPTTLTISAGEVTVTQNYHVIDTEAAGASDDLETISGGADGMVLLFRQANDARDVTVKHATGNIRTTGGGDILLTSRYQTVVMVYDDTLDVWLAAEIHARIHDINGDDHTGQLYITAGCLSTPSYTNNGSGNITVDAVSCVFFTTDDFTGKPVQATIGPLTETLTDNVTNYVIGDYNGGTPVMDIITDVSLINSSSVIPIYTIVRTGTVLHTHSWDEMAHGLADKLNRRFIKTQRYARESGLATSETGTRNLIVSAGVVWEGQSPVNLAEVLTATDKLILCYHSSGNWTQDYTQTAYNNTQYDNGTDLATLTANRYAVNWVYRGVEDQKHVYVTLGTGNYTLAQAQAATVPTPPAIVTSHAVLIAKIIVQKSAATAVSIQSAFDTAFSPATASAHNDLTGLQGGTASEYYHLTSAQSTLLTALVIDTATYSVKTSGGDFTTIQAAVDFLKGKVLRGVITINVDAGSWDMSDTALDLSGITTNIGAQVKFVGDTRACIGTYYIDGVCGNQANVANMGTQNQAPDITVSSDTITVDNATTDPAFDTAGVVAGDYIYLFKKGAASVITNVASVSGKTITVTTGTIPASFGATYDVLAILPNRIINRTTGAGNVITADGQQNISFDGFLIRQTVASSTSTYGVWVKNSASLFLDKCAVICRNTYPVWVDMRSQYTHNKGLVAGIYNGTTADIYVQNQSLGDIDYVMCTEMEYYGLLSYQSSTIDAYYHACVNGNNAASYGMFCSRQSFIMSETGKMANNYGGGYAAENAYLRARNIAYAGITTQLSPATNNEGNTGGWTL